MALHDDLFYLNVLGLSKGFCTFDGGEAIDRGVTRDIVNAISDASALCLFKRDDSLIMPTEVGFLQYEWMKDSTIRITTRESYNTLYPRLKSLNPVSDLIKLTDSDSFSLTDDIVKFTENFARGMVYHPSDDDWVQGKPGVDFTNGVSIPWIISTQFVLLNHAYQNHNRMFAISIPCQGVCVVHPNNKSGPIMTLLPDDRFYGLATKGRYS